MQLLNRTTLKLFHHQFQFFCAGYDRATHFLKHFKEHLFLWNQTKHVFTSIDLIFEHIGTAS